MRQWIFLSPFLLFFGAAKADIAGNFTFPSTAGITIELGTTITITWDLGDPEAYINLWMSQYGHDNIAQPIVQGYQGNSYDWNVATMSNQDILLDSNFHFHMVDANGTTAEQESGGFWSLGFVLKNTQVLSATPNPTATPTSSLHTPMTISPATSTFSTTTTTGSSASTSSSVPPPSGLSTGAKAGIAIGIVIPLTIAIGFGALWIWWQRKKLAYVAKANAEAQHQQHMSYAKDAAMQWSPVGYAVVPQLGPAELPVVQKPVEMDGQQAVSPQTPHSPYLGVR